MKLSEIVRINEKGMVANAVNLKMMDDPEKNLQLCQGFIFNYDAQKPKESTVGVLIKIQESFHGQNHPNVHLVVQDYGKGKSHFALVMANFFKQPADSAEVRGILHQIEMAVGSHGSVGEDLKNYKERNKPHLVIRLSGDQMTDLKAAFLKSLRVELDTAGVTESIGQHLCAEPLNFLRQLDDADRQQAEKFLTETQPNLNVAALIKELEDDNYSLIHLVKEISREVHKYGKSIEFESDLDLETVLSVVVKKLCVGAEARFAGVLILFDELLPYLQGYASDPNRYGGSALQNLTNVCESTECKSKLALVTFSQVRPQVRDSIGVPLQSLNDYQKLTSRLEKLESTYEPRASLELVIDNLIIQEEGAAEWKEFDHRWHSTLKHDSEQVFNHFTPTYREQSWDVAEFNRHLAFGSFPLHPLTACLLANFEFTQNRTVIDFIKANVKAHIETEAAALNGKPNYIYAYQLVEAFKSSLSGNKFYPDYQKARDQIRAVADPVHLHVLESLFLYYASKNLSKNPDDEHSKILSAISGLSEMTVRGALIDLSEKGVLYYVGHSKLYQFYQGASPNDVTRLVDDEIGDKHATLSELARYCEQLPFFTQTSVVTPDSYVNEFKLVGDDWQYTRIAIPAHDLEKSLSVQGRLLSERGLVAHILYEQAKDRQGVYEQAQKLLDKHPESHRVVIAIPEEPAGDLLRVLKQKTALEGFKDVEKQRLGAAYEQQLENWAKTLSSRLEKVVTRSEYYCVGIDKLQPSEKKNPQELISQMLRQTYRFAPPVARVDKMRTGHATGTKVSGFIARKLLSGDEIPHPLPDNAYKGIFDQIFTDSWHLFIPKSDRYKVNTPTNPKVKTAWDEIDNMTALGEAEFREISVEEIWKKLSAPPFGYNDLTFTVLFTAWLAVHRREVAFRGDLSIPQKKKEIPQSTKIAAPISEWANTNVFEKPKEFLSDWAPKKQNRLIRRKPATMPTMPERCDYDEAKELLSRIKEFLAAGSGAPDQIAEAKKTHDELVKAIKRLDDWAEAIRKFEEVARQSDLNVLLSKVYSERKRYHPPAVTSGTPAVSPSEEHRKSSDFVLGGLEDLVHSKINELAARAERVTSDQEFGAYKNELERMHRLLTGPLEKYKETLQTALQGAKARIENRKREDAIKAVTDEVRGIGNLIDATTSQNWCVTNLDRLDSLAQANPQLTREVIFQSVRRKVETCLETLTIQLAEWEKKLTAIANLQGANELRNEINQQFNRYTEIGDRKRVDDLRAHADRVWNELQQRERAEANQETAFNEFKLIVERIIGADLQRTPAIYDEGLQKQAFLMENPQTDQAFAHRLIAEWQRGQERIREKLTEAISEELHEISGYSSLKTKLESAAEVARIEYFAEFDPRIAEALEKLEAKHEELNIEQKDHEILRQIKGHNARHLHTVAALDEAEMSICELRAELRKPEKFAADIQKTLLEIEEKRGRHNRQLEALEARINTARTSEDLSALAKEMLRIEASFKESSLSAKYEVLESNLRELRETADLIATVRSEAEKSRAIADCLRTKAQCEEIATQIKDSRFEGQTDELISQLERKMERLVGHLANFEKQLHEGGFEQVKMARHELLRSSSQYTNSPYQDECDRLMAEAETVEKLLELGGKQPNSIESAGNLLEEIQRLMESGGGETIWKRGKESLSAVSAHQDTLRKEEENKAKKALENYYKQWKEIETESDPISKIRQSEKFLSEVWPHKQVLNQYLPIEHQSDFDELIMAVHSALDGDRETQICDLFSKLPEEMRSRVYARLGELIATRHVTLTGQDEIQPIVGAHD